MTAVKGFLFTCALLIATALLVMLVARTLEDAGYGHGLPYDNAFVISFALHVGAMFVAESAK